MDTRLYEDLKKNNSKIRIIIFSVYTDLKAIRGMVDIGASGFISKSASRHHLEKAIMDVADGKFFFDCNHGFSKCKGIHSLTLRELEVARLLCSNLPYKQ